MDATPFQGAAIGLLIVAAGTLAVALNDRVARLFVRAGAPERRAALQARCRDYTLWLLIAAVALAYLSRAF